MSSRGISAPFEEAAIVGLGYRGTPEGRTRFIAQSTAQLQRLCASPTAQSDTVRFLLQEADKMIASPQTLDATPAVSIIAVLAELSKSAAVLKDAADLLWRSADRLNPSVVPFVTEVFTRVAFLGPSDAFGVVVERIIRTFASGADAPYIRKLFAVWLVEPITEHHPNLFLTRLHPFFSGVWAVARDMVEGENGRGAPRLKDAFARAVDLLRRVASSFPGIISDLNEKLRQHLKSKRDVDIIIGIAFMEPITMMRSTNNPISYAELWAVLWPLRDRTALRFQLLSAFVSLARFDSTSFTIDRRTEKEKQDASSSRQDHRNLVMDFVEDLWKRDNSLETSKQVLKFYLRLIAVKFPRETAFTEHQIDAYFLSTIRFKLVSRTATKVAGQHPLEGCWDVLTLLSRICRMFRLSQTVMDAQVAPCIIKVLEWGTLAPEIKETLPDMIRCFSPAQADKVLTLLLDIVSKTLSGRPFRPGASSLPEAATHDAARSTSTFKLVAEKLNPVQLFHHLHGPERVMSSGTDAADQVDRTEVALQTLATFGISDSDVMGDFIVQTLLPLLSHESVSVRLEVLRTLRVLAVPASGPSARATSRRSFAYVDVSSPALSRVASISVPTSLGGQSFTLMSPPGSPTNFARSIAAASDRGGSPDQIEVLSATRTNVVRQVVDALLATATSDPDSGVRAACLSVVCDDLLAHVQDPASLRFVFQSIVDSDSDVRLVAQRLMCLLEPRHQALVAPSLRRTLVAAFNRLSLPGVAESNPDEAIQNLCTLSTLLRYAPRTAEVYHKNVSVVLKSMHRYARVPLANEPLAAAIVSVMAAVTVGAGQLMDVESAELCLDIVSGLLDDNVPSALRSDALVTLSDLATHAPIDIASVKYRGSARARIFATRRILQSSSSALPLRMAALRSLGAVGAVDPDLLQQALEDSPAEGTKPPLPANSQSELPRDDSEEAAAGVLLAALGRLIVAATGRDDFDAVLRLHLRTLMAVIDGCRAADDSYTHVVAALVQVLHRMVPEGSSGGVSSTFFTTAYQLVRCVGVHLHESSDGGDDNAKKKVGVLPWDALVALAKKLNDQGDNNVRVCGVALVGVIVASPTGKAECAMYFKHLIPTLLDPTRLRASGAEGLVVPTIEVLSHVPSHLPQFRSQIIAWIRGYLGRPSVSVQCATDLARFIRYMCHSGVHLREYAATIMRPLLDVLPKFAASSEFLHEAFGVFASIAKQIHTDFAPFLEAIPNDLLMRDQPVMIRTFRRLWAAIGRSTMRSGPLATRNRWRDIDCGLSPTEVEEYFPNLAQRTHAVTKATLTWGESDSPQFVPKELVDDGSHSDVQRPERPLDEDAERVLAAVASTPESTPAFLHALMATFLEVSPYRVLRSVSEPHSEAAKPIVQSVFFPGFRAVWRRAGADLRKVLCSCILELLDKQLADEHALLLLGLAEYMKMVGNPLYIDPPVLAPIALRHEAAAKALHWEEESFLAERDVAERTGETTSLVRHAEELIMMYGKVNSSASAIGLLRTLKLPNDVKQVLTEESLINLRRYDEALAVKQRSEALPPRPRAMSRISDNGIMHRPVHSRVRSGSNFADVSFSLPGTVLVEDHSRMKCHYMLGQMGAVLQVRLPTEAPDEEDTARQMVRLAADAAIALGDWGALERAIDNPNFVHDSVPYCIASCVLEIHRRKYFEASVLIDRGRRLLVDEVGSLLGESYTRAYESVVAAQQLVELEETIQVFSTAPDARDAARCRVEQLWSRRLALVSWDVHTWRRLLMTRRLLVSPSQDIANRLQFCDLCAENRMPQLRCAALMEMAGRTPSIEELASGVFDARLAANYAD
jgi:hypothetical protein